MVTFTSHTNNSTVVFVDEKYFCEINNWGVLIIDGTDDVHELTPAETSTILTKALEIKQATEDGTATAE